MRPPPRDHLSSKINLHDQSICKCVQELYLFHSIQKELQLTKQFLQKFVRWRRAGSKMNEIKNLPVPPGQGMSKNYHIKVIGKFILSLNP